MRKTVGSIVILPTQPSSIWKVCFRDGSHYQIIVELDCVYIYLAVPWVSLFPFIG